MSLWASTTKAQAKQLNMGEWAYVGDQVLNTAARSKISLPAVLTDCSKKKYKEENFVYFKHKFLIKETKDQRQYT